MRKVIFGILFFVVSISSCNKKEKGSVIKEKNNQLVEIYVDTINLKLSSFKTQLICNGKLNATKYSDLNFENGGILTKVYVHNGSHVKAGQLIAVVDKSANQLALAQAQKDLARAKVELTDKLIGLGYDGISDDIPSDVMQRAQVNCGYYSALYAVQLANDRLEKCNLYAPYSGRIANLTNARYQRVDRLCTLISDDMLTVSFNILETELVDVHKGQTILIISFANDNRRYSGVITDINPIVSSAGLVEVRAKLDNTSEDLYMGMNVRVILEENIGKSFVVPKDAVSERNGYNVVFKYQEGHAVWTYVDILHSNINSYAISGSVEKGTTLQNGDIIIISGVANLADGTIVKLNKK